MRCLVDCGLTMVLLTVLKVDLYKNKGLDDQILIALGDNSLFSSVIAVVPQITGTLWYGLR